MSMPKWLWFGLIGVVLLTSAAIYWCRIWISDPVRPADTREAFRRLASVPLRDAGSDRGMEVKVTIPDSTSWKRIIRHWGDPGYFIGAILPGPRRYMYCLKDLGVRAEVRLANQPVDLETAEVPYGYSIDCEPAGIAFRAPPGAVVQVRLVVTHPPLHPVEVIIEPYWTTGTKDRIVGIAIEEQFHVRSLAIAIGAVGIIAIFIAAFLFSHQAPKPSG
jgi:hypothetical protein